MPENRNKTRPVRGEPTASEVEVQLRQLALIDRVIGLEGEVARLSIAGPTAAGPRAEIERLRSELAVVYGSLTWRIGTAILRPARALRRLLKG